MFEKYFKQPQVQIRLRQSELADHLDTFIIHLSTRGHPPSAIQRYAQAAGHFGQWLAREYIPIRSVNEATVHRFLYDHLPKCQCLSPFLRDLKTAQAALRQLLIVLGKHESEIAEECTPVDRAVHAFKIYLEQVRGLAPRTCLMHTGYLHEFLQGMYGNGPVKPKKLKPSDLMEFVSQRAKGCKPRTARGISSSLRGYLRFLQMRGLCDETLIGAVPSVPCWKSSYIPKTLGEDEIHRFLSSFDRTTSVGRRDYAMALCLVELGLRAGEVTRIQLEDLNWREATLRIMGGKTRRERRYPLPRRVGEAIAAYLCNGRPSTAERYLFVRHTVPKGMPMNSHLLYAAMRRAYARARFSTGWSGTHILRHTAATRMLHRGANLKEIADVLGHQSIETTTIYAKVNLPRLAQVAMPWPEVES